jgi:molecular chaperone GrpE
MKEKQVKPDEVKAPKSTFTVIDRRHKADEAADDQYKTRYPSLVEQLQQRLAAKDQLLAEFKEKLTQENEAYKKRLEREMQTRLQNEKLQLVSRLLPVLDNLNRALESAAAKHNYHDLLQGLKRIEAQFWSQLKTEGVSRLKTKGKTFDPNTQEATEVVIVKDKKQDHLVSEEVEAGYLLGDKLIRPAKVKVGQFR